MSSYAGIKRTMIVCGSALLGFIAPAYAQQNHSAPNHAGNPSQAQLPTLVMQGDLIPSSTLRESTIPVKSVARKHAVIGQSSRKLSNFRISFTSDAEIRKNLQLRRDEPINRSTPSRGWSRGRLAYRGYFVRGSALNMVATGYSPSASENGGSTSGLTATGRRIGHGVVAVDPRFIRLGTRLYIEGYGYAIAADTGGDIKGHRIDLGFSSYRHAQDVGRRRVTVHILK